MTTEVIGGNTARFLVETNQGLPRFLGEGEFVFGQPPEIGVLSRDGRRRLTFVRPCPVFRDVVEGCWRRLDGEPYDVVVHYVDRNHPAARTAASDARKLERWTREFANAWLDNDKQLAALHAANIRRLLRRNSATVLIDDLPRRGIIAGWANSRQGILEFEWLAGVRIIGSEYQTTAILRP